MLRRRCCLREELLRMAGTILSDGATSSVVLIDSSSARRRRMASIPSSTGICRSIRTASKGGLCACALPSMDEYLWWGGYPFATTGIRWVKSAQEFLQCICAVDCLLSNHVTLLVQRRSTSFTYSSFMFLMYKIVVH